MATKAQEEAKKKAAEIAASAKKARGKKADAPKAEAPKAEAPKAEEPKKEAAPKKEASKTNKSDALIEAANTSRDTETRTAVTAEAAEKFKTSSDDIDMFLRRTINIPGRRALRKAFEEEEIIGDDYGEVITEGKKRELEYQLLADSAKAKRPKILLGRVRGIDPVYNDKQQVYTYEARVSLIADPADPKTRELMAKKQEPASIYSVYIPAPMFFFYRKPELFEGPDGLRNLLRSMRNKVGSLVEFIVYDISADDNRVIGSRVRAMQMRAYEYYLDPRRKKIVPGTKAMGRITESGVHGVTVEVKGAECFIPNNELSWLRVPAANDEDQFKVGKAIPVVVESVEIGNVQVFGKDTQYVVITASAKKAKKTPIQEFGATYPDNSFASGIVTYRYATEKYCVRIDNRIDCMCYPPDFDTPFIGAEVSVYITGRNEIGLLGDFSFIAH